MFALHTVPLIIIVVTRSPALGHGTSSVTVCSNSPPTPPSPGRYEILTPNAIPKGFMDGKQACEKMVSEG